MHLFPALKNKYIIYIDQFGKPIIETKFQRGTEFSEGFAAVFDNQKYGFIDSSGNVCIDFVYDKVGKFNECFCNVCKNGKWGMIDCNGELVIKLKYAEMGVCSCKRICVQLEAGVDTMYIDSKDQIIIKENGATGISIFTEQLVVSRDDAKKLDGFRDVNGNWAIEPKFYAATMFSYGVAGVKKEIKKKVLTGFIDKNGTEVLPFVFNSTIPKFCCGLAVVTNRVKNEDLFGAINIKGEWVIQPILKYLQDYSDGLALFRTVVNGKAGFVDTKGSVVINEKYKNALPFNDGLARVQDEKGWLYINKKGEEVWRFE